MPENDARSAKLRYRLSTQDATFLYGESTSGPLHIGSILIFEGQIPFDEILDHIASRIHLVPRYRQRLARVPFNLHHAGLEDDPDFDVSHHVFRHELAPGVSEADAIDAVLAIYEPPLRRDRPLWEMHSFENVIGNRTFIVSKVHHCLVDGVSGVELLKVMFDFRPDPPEVPPPDEPYEPRRMSGTFRRLSRATRDLITATSESIRQVASGLRQDPRATEKQLRLMVEGSRTIAELASRRLVAAPWNAGLCTQKRRLAYSKMAFAEFRAMRSVLGGSLNDLVLTVLSEGAARYLRDHGVNAEGRPLCIGCPVNVRHNDEQSALGNRVSMMFPTFSAEPMEIRERLKQVREATDQIKRSRAPQSLETLMTLGDLVPPSLIGIASRVATLGLDSAAAVSRVGDLVPPNWRPAVPALGINFVATNVPGVLVPQYLLGHQCLDQIPLIPLGATLGLGVAILSYNTSLYIGFMSEPRLMPDVELLKDRVDEAFEELKAAAARDASRVTAIRQAEQAPSVDAS